MPATGSTNDDLLAAAATGAPDRSVLVADHQTAGRGRLDRRWEAPPGVNLLVSILFRTVPIARLGADPAGRAGRDRRRAVRAAGVDAVLKWPNDLLVDDRKLAGILAQRAADGSIVVGLGLNVGWAPDGAVSLRAACARVGVAARADAASTCWWRSSPRSTRFPTTSATGTARALATLGRRVEVQVPGGRIDGRAVDIDADGRLVVVDTCGLTHRLDVGDVVHVRDAGPPAR